MLFRRLQHFPAAVSNFILGISSFVDALTLTEDTKYLVSTDNIKEILKGLGDSPHEELKSVASQLSESLAWGINMISTQSNQLSALTFMHIEWQNHQFTMFSSNAYY